MPVLRLAGEDIWMEVVGSDSGYLGEDIWVAVSGLADEAIWVAVYLGSSFSAGGEDIWMEV